MVIVLMGVAGSGKTTVGEMLARRLVWPFHDADDLHSAPNREKMSRGFALTDEDRRSWLDAVHDLVQRYVTDRRDALIACSALKQLYRQRMAVSRAVVKFVYLKGSYELIAARLAARHGHFFNPQLLRSQFDVLEEPDNAAVEEISRDPKTIVESIVAKLRI